jgi:AhpD family alkylhydroperoxidase
MTPRINPAKVAPGLMKAVRGVEDYVRGNVDPTLFNLIKMRASIINGCTFCVDMHGMHALEAGERPERLFGLAAWREAPFYSDAERAALALTDAATRLGEEGVPDAVWAEAAAVFDERQLADLVGAIGVINMWNRIAIGFRTTPLSALAA